MENCLPTLIVLIWGLSVIKYDGPWILVPEVSQNSTEVVLKRQVINGGVKNCWKYTVIVPETHSHKKFEIENKELTQGWVRDSWSPKQLECLEPLMVGWRRQSGSLVLLIPNQTAQAANYRGVGWREWSSFVKIITAPHPPISTCLRCLRSMALGVGGAWGINNDSPCTSDRSHWVSVLN